MDPELALIAVRCESGCGLARSAWPVGTGFLGCQGFDYVEASHVRLEYHGHLGPADAHAVSLELRTVPVHVLGLILLPH